MSTALAWKRAIAGGAISFYDRESGSLCVISCSGDRLIRLRPGSWQEISYEVCEPPVQRRTGKLALAPGTFEVQVSPGGNPLRTFDEEIVAAAYQRVMTLHPAALRALVSSTVSADETRLAAELASQLQAAARTARLLDALRGQELVRSLEGDARQLGRELLPGWSGSADGLSTLVHGTLEAPA